MTKPQHFSKYTVLSSTNLFALAALTQIQSVVGSVTFFPDNVKTFIHVTKPLPLQPGQVTNAYHRISIPRGPIAIYEFTADVVEKDNDSSEGNDNDDDDDSNNNNSGGEDKVKFRPAPLSDAYLHHHVVASNHKAYQHMKSWWSPMKPSQASRAVAFGAGTESRGTPQKFPFPYAFTTVPGEDEFIANVHIINTRNMPPTEAHACLECPCTAVDTYKTNATLLASVARKKKSWDHCNLQLLEEHNAVCHPETYHGGLLCCEEGEFCLDKFDEDLTTSSNNNSRMGIDTQASPQTNVSAFYLRYNITYAPVVPENKPLLVAACCDATGNLTVKGNIEYDIPQQCQPSDRLEDKCIHNLTTHQQLHGAVIRDYSSRGSSRNHAHDGASDNPGHPRRTYENKDEWVDVVFMVGHLHRGGIDLTAYDDATGDIICRSLPIYGTGVGVIGNESGYINAMTSCTFDPPQRMKTTDIMRIESRYDAREAHTGVMGLWYIAIAEVHNDDDHRLRSAGNDFWLVGRNILCLVAAGILVTVGKLKYETRSKRRRYEMVPSTSFDV